MDKITRKLIIRLGKTPDQVQWCELSTVFDASSREMHQGRLADIDAKDAEVWVLLPSEDVVLTEVEVPKANRSRLRQAIPFLLEDKLVDDVDELHFAYPEGTALQPLPVAVFTNEKLDRWQSWFKNTGITPTWWAPESLILPIADKTWNIVIHHQTAWLQTGRYHAITLDPDNVVLGLQLAWSERDEELRPNKLHLFLDRPLSAETHAAIEAIIRGTDVSLETSVSKHWLCDLTEITPPAIDLLQGSGAKLSRSKALGPWRLASYMLLIVLVWQGISRCGEYIYWTVQDIDMQQQIASVYRQIFPDAETITNPQAMVEREWEKVSQAAGQSGFIHIMSVVGQILQQSDGVDIRSASYRTDQLTLLVHASSFAVLEQLTTGLRDVGLVVTQDSATTREEGVDGRLLIKQG